MQLHPIADADAPIWPHRQTMQSSREDVYSERRLVQRQLEEAIDALRGAGAAYASVVEFPPSSIIVDERHSGRRLGERSSKMLDEHNEGVREHNEYRRRFSRYEWTLRGEDERARATAGDDRKMQTEDGGTGAPSLLVGTGWRVVEVALPAVPDDNSTRHALVSILPDAPVTLAFSDDSARVSGSSGCNRYRSSLHPSNSTDRSFETGYVGGTRMYCHSPEGVMEQEMAYTKFLTKMRFFYELVKGDDDGRQLVLLDSVTRAKGRTVPGDVVARFVEEPTEDGPGESGERIHISFAIWKSQ